jgi:hypothetical protein
MPPSNCDPTATPISATPIDPTADDLCPKCGVAMEPIEIGVEGLPLQRLQLCPRCYLVMWSDQYGLHSRQGVPMKEGFNPSIKPMGTGSVELDPRRLTSDPEEC